MLIKQGLTCPENSVSLRLDFFETGLWKYLWGKKSSNDFEKKYFFQVKSLISNMTRSFRHAHTLFVVGKLTRLGQIRPCMVNTDDSREAKRSDVEKFVDDLSRNFRVKPNQDFLTNVVQIIEKQLRVHELPGFREEILRNYSSFPSIKSLTESIGRYIRNRRTVVAQTTERKIYHNRWESRQAPGTPASAEAIFILMQGPQGRYEDRAIQNFKERYRMSDDELMICFQEWTEGRCPQRFKTEG